MGESFMLLPSGVLIVWPSCAAFLKRIVRLRPKFVFWKFFFLFG
jgi:hypothetical protein